MKNSKYTKFHARSGVSHHDNHLFDLYYNLRHNLSVMILKLMVWVQSNSDDDWAETTGQKRLRSSPTTIAGSPQILNTIVMFSTTMPATVRLMFGMNIMKEIRALK